MLDRPVWFNACIIGAVFGVTLLAASAHVGFFTFLLNIVAVGCLVAPMVLAVRDGEVKA